VKCKCGLDVKWSEWNYFTHRGYKTRVNLCHCQEPSIQSQPFSKEKKAFWNAMIPVPLTKKRKEERGLNE